MSLLMGWNKKNLLAVCVFFMCLGVIAPTLAQDSPVGQGMLSRGMFTSGIENREPIDSVAKMVNTHKEIFFFSELKFMQGRTVIHRWQYKGKTMAEVEFKVGGPRWRVYSKKALYAGQTGEWSVVVLDKETGWPLAVEIFHYTAN